MMNLFINEVYFIVVEFIFDFDNMEEILVVFYWVSWRIVEIFFRKCFDILFFYCDGIML